MVAVPATLGERSGFSTDLKVAQRALRIVAQWNAANLLDAPIRVNAPTLLAWTAADPDHDDATYSAGDTLTLTMDMATDALVPPRLVEGDKLYVDALFAFSHSLGADYSGAWRDGESEACTDGGLTLTLTLTPTLTLTLILTLLVTLTLTPTQVLFLGRLWLSSPNPNPDPNPDPDPKIGRAHV